MQHTPGPWKFDKEKSKIISMNHWFVEPSEKDEEEGIRTTIINTFGAMGGDNTQADAFLMAAAPNLLEACRMAYRVLLQLDDHEDYTIRTINNLDVAIERAKGEQRP